MREQRERTTGGLKKQSNYPKREAEKLRQNTTWSLRRFLQLFMPKPKPGQSQVGPMTHGQESAMRPIGARYLETVRPQAPLLTGGSLLQVAGLQRYQRQSVLGHQTTVLQPIGKRCAVVVKSPAPRGAPPGPDTEALETQGFCVTMKTHKEY